MNVRRFIALVAILFCPALAQGQQKPANATASARVHFKSGLEHAANGELDAALRDFEAAYELQPHYSVLYNIAQAEAALGRPTAAIRSFQRYLVDGGKHLTQARRDEVAALLEETHKKVGELRLTVNSPTTRVWLDGLEVGQAALAQPISLPIGPHSVISSDAGGPPLAQTVLLKSASVTELKLDPPQLPPPQQPRALLLVSCAFSGVSVELDGASVARTPVRQPLLVSAGPRTVRFSRPGYRDVTRQVFASTLHATTVACDLTRESVLPPHVGALLKVRTSPRDALVFVDGQRFLGEVLPTGMHELRVERDGFKPWTKTIELQAQKSAAHDVTLEPTEMSQRRQAQAVLRRRTFGYVGLGGGFALVATGVGLFAWNGGRYDDWHDTRDSEGYGKQLQAVSSIQRVDDIAFASMALGTGLVAVGAWLLLTNPPTSE